jgi:hypothetical protein
VFLGLGLKDSQTFLCQRIIYIYIYIYICYEKLFLYNNFGGGSNHHIIIFRVSVLFKHMSFAKNLSRYFRLEERAR